MSSRVFNSSANTKRIFIVGVIKFASWTNNLFKIVVRTCGVPVF